MDNSNSSDRDVEPRRKHDDRSTQRPSFWVISIVVAAAGIGILFSPLLQHVTSLAARALFHDIPDTLVQRLGLPGLATSFYSQTSRSKPDRSDWTLTTESFIPNHYQAAPSVSNGYFGQALPSEGVGYWVEQKPDGSDALNGWPLDQPRATFGTISGFWNLQEKVKHPILEENVRRGGESVISGIPDWTGLILTTDQGDSYKPGVDRDTILQYAQGLSLADGIVTTNVTWHPAKSEHAFQMNFTVLAHQARLTLGLVRLDLTVRGPLRFTVTDVLDGEGASRTNFADKSFGDPGDGDNVIWTSVKPWGVENTTAYIASNVGFWGLTEPEASEVEESRRHATATAEVVSQHLSTIAQSWNVNIAKDETRTISVVKHVGIASTDAFASRAQAIALDTASNASRLSWGQLVHEHRASWNRIWDDTEIVVPGDTEVQTTVRAAMFHLLTNTVSGGEDEKGVAVNPKGMTENSISVGGLTSDSYAGLVFWDSEVWMYPALLALHPDRARPILNYRQRLLPQAEKNSQLYARPGALFPWTSGRYGNCTGTGVCALYQYHLNTDIAMAHWNYYLHDGDDSWLRDKAWPIIKSVADMFAEYVVLNETTGSYETIRLGEPDEFAYDIDNGAYTNAGIKMLLGDWAPQAAEIIAAGNRNAIAAMVSGNWSRIAADIKIPYADDEQIIVEYDGMDGTIQIKQASVTLISYPLGWRISEEQALNDMAFYSRATTANGPAMTWAIYAILALQLHPSGCAGYTYLLQASQPYIREPFYQFSEQRTDAWSVAEAAQGVGDKAAELTAHLGSETSAAFPFLTGYGGYLQIFTHGFTGIRPELDAESSGGAVLVVDPVMVPQFPDGLQVRGVKFRGAVLDFSIGLITTTITRRRLFGANPPLREERGPITIRVGGKAMKRADFVVRAGDHITIPTRRADRSSTTVPGNLAQCAPVSTSSHDLSSSASTAAWVAGRHPVAAVDGSVDTVWQPLSPDQESSFVIDLGETKRVSGAVVNWANAPATRFLIEGDTEIGALTETESGAWRAMVKMDSVPISAPYDPAKAHRIAVPDSNLTTVAFEQTWDVRRVRFTIEGTQGVDAGSGATVAEISIL